jgi:hypothetical protein
MHAAQTYTAMLSPGSIKIEAEPKRSDLLCCILILWRQIPQGQSCYFDYSKLHLCAQVILAFADNWQKTGGIDEYIEWTKDPTKSHKDFYTDSLIKQW